MPINILVDGHHLYYRCYFGAPDHLQTAKGEKSGAFMSALNEIRIWIQRYNPTNFFITYDYKSWRKHYSKDYKANREYQEDPQFWDQMNSMIDFFSAAGIEQIKIKGWESDDLNAELSRVWFENDISSFIISGDSDMRQCVKEEGSKFIRIITPKSGYLKEDKIYSLDAVKEKYHGLSGKQLVQMWTLTGQKKDNIIGLERIGDKTAAKILDQNQSIGHIFKNERVQGVSIKKEKLVLGSKELLKRNYKLINLIDPIKNHKNELIDWISNILKVKHSEDTMLQLLRKYELKVLFQRDWSFWQGVFRDLQSSS